MWSFDLTRSGPSLTESQHPLFKSSWSGRFNSRFKIGQASDNQKVKLWKYCESLTGQIWLLKKVSESGQKFEDPLRIISENIYAFCSEINLSLESVNQTQSPKDARPRRKKDNVAQHCCSDDTRRTRFCSADSISRALPAPPHHCHFVVQNCWMKLKCF